MRTSRSFAATVLALGLVLSLTATVMAKGDAVVTLDAPLPTDPAPGSTIIVAWTLDILDDPSSPLPVNAEGVFVRFASSSGEPLEVVARQDRVGHYVATITVPDGGLGTAVFGLRGQACFASGGCERSDVFFRVATDTRQPVPAPVVAPVVHDAAVTPADLTWLPFVALVGVAAVALVLLARGRDRTAAA